MKTHTNARLLLLAAGIASVSPVAAVTVISTPFNTTGNTDGWSAVNGSTLSSTGGQLVLTNPSPDITRATLAFTSTTIGTTGDFIEVSYNVIFTSSTNGVQRQFETSLWDSATSDGYIGAFHIGTTSITNRFVETPNISSSGVTSTGGSTITASGDTTTSLRPTATNNTFVHTISLRIEKTASGISLSSSGLDNGNTTRTITATDNTTPYLTFNQLDLNTWGNNNVNFTIDNVLVTTNVPEPSAALLGCLGSILLLRRRRVS